VTLRRLLPCLLVLSTVAEPQEPPAKPPEPAQPQPAPLAQWVFANANADGRLLKAARGPWPARIEGPLRFESEGSPGALRLDGRSQRVVLGGAEVLPLLPRRALSAEAWLRMDREVEWGGILGALQDNGDFEKGWLLGSRRDRFVFAVATRSAGKLTYLEAKSRFRLGAWHHVAGTYDGSEMRVFVDGRLEAESAAQKGDIDYPPAFHFEIGAYHDDDEHYRLVGAVHEVSLFDRVLSAEDVAERYMAKETLFSPPAELAGGPFVEFPGASIAAVSWETPRPSATLLLHGPGEDLGLRSEDAEPRTSHRIVLGALGREGRWWFSPRVVSGKSVEPGKTYSFDRGLNPRLPPLPERPSPFPEDAWTAVYQRTADWIVASSGVRQGYCLILGGEDGRLAHELVKRTELKVVVREEDPQKAAATRRALDAVGLYGLRVSVHEGPLDALPYGDYFANLVLSEAALTRGELRGSAKEVHRILRPCGGTLLVGQPAELPAGESGKKGKNFSAEALRAWLDAGGMAGAEVLGEAGLWGRFRRPPLPGAGEWTHQYGSADNSACSQDRLATGPMDLLWWGRPGPNPMPDRGARNPAPLYADGRLFVLGDRVLFGIDAYNGTALWTLVVPELRRANVPRDASNLAASADALYIALGPHCWRLDAETGARTQKLSLPLEGEDLEWGYLAVVGDALLGSAQFRGASYRGDDGEWFDGGGPEDVAKVTSRYLFALDPKSGREKWIYKEGVAVNSSLAASPGAVYLVESRSPQAVSSREGRLTRELASHQFLVALDLETGSRLWEIEQDFSSCHRMLYVSWARDTVLVAGTSERYHLWAFDAKTGKRRWRREQPWERDHHGGLIQHPVIAGDTIYSVRSAFDLRTGDIQRSDLPERRGCGTISASLGSLFYRHYFHGRWDAATGKATEWLGIRSGCWLSILPAGGVVLAPETSSGCSCTDTLQISAAFLPRPGVEEDPVQGK
jgi:hypothetical protein